MPDSSYLMLLYFVNKKETAQKNRNVYKSIRNESKQNETNRDETKQTKTKLVTFEEKLLMLCE
jgi:hypothetical protein